MKSFFVLHLYYFARWDLFEDLLCHWVDTQEKVNLASCRLNLFHNPRGSIGLSIIRKIGNLEKMLKFPDLAI
jgi:hypothetical protein